MNEPAPETMDSDRFAVGLVDGEIDASAMIARATRPSCGSVLLFLGTTRQWTRVEVNENAANGLEETAFLFYEAYNEMALEELRKLSLDALSRWNLSWVEIVHRLGRVDIGQASVAVVVASPHRKESFAAGEWIMDRLKESVPIWKRDHSANAQNPTWKHPE